MKKETFYNSAIAAVLIGIVAVILFKFVLIKKEGADDIVSISPMDQVTLNDLNGGAIPLQVLLEAQKAAYVLLFYPEDCFGCIYDGIQDLKKYQSEGYTCIAIVISDKIDDVRGWTSVNFEDFNSFYTLKKTAYTDFFKVGKTPVMIKLKDKKIESHYRVKLKTNQ